MSRRLWLLVEWLGDNEVFSSYGVVNASTLPSGENNFDIGNVIFVPGKHNNGVRHAKILRISDKKRNVKELKMLLEKQDNQMKNVLSLCMNTLKDMKTTTMYLNPESNTVEDTDLSSEDDEEHSQDLNYSTVKNKFPKKRPSLSISRIHNLSGTKQAQYNSRRSLMSSTPFPDSSKLTFDQATQTEETLDPNIAKIEQLETMLQKLYQQFLNLIGEATTSAPRTVASVDFSETEISEMDNHSEVAACKEANGDGQSNLPHNINEDKIKQAKRLCIRRASAQTTNASLPNPGPDANMIPIGAGTTKIPVTIINAIDWSSYSTATRQLLQAIFPRKILATHSLTGKQSPAFANKPPKKALDSHIVNDIVDTVSDVCGVSKRIVRSCITTKCTDEAKLYRNRQQYKQNNESRVHQDNTMPASPSVNDSTTRKE